MLEHIATDQRLKAPVHADRLTVYLDPSPNTGDIFKHPDPSDVINTEAYKTPHQPMQQNAQGIMQHYATTKSSTTYIHTQ